MRRLKYLSNAWFRSHFLIYISFFCQKSSNSQEAFNINSKHLFPFALFKILI